MTLKKILYKIYPVNEVAVRVLTLKKSTAVEGNPAEETPVALPQRKKRLRRLRNK